MERGNDYIIIQATPNYAPQLYEYVTSRLAELNIDPDEFRIRSVFDEQDEIEEFLADDASEFFFAMDKDQRVLGTVTLSGNYLRHLEVRSSTNHIAQLGISVLPECRGQGVGKELLRTAIDHAKERNVIKRIEATSYATNQPARQFLLDNGFEIEGWRKKAILKDDEYIDAAMLAYIIE